MGAKRESATLLSMPYTKGLGSMDALRWVVPRGRLHGLHLVPGRVPARPEARISADSERRFRCAYPFMPRRSRRADLDSAFASPEAKRGADWGRSTLARSKLVGATAPPHGLHLVSQPAEATSPDAGEASPLAALAQLQEAVSARAAVTASDDSLLRELHAMLTALADVVADPEAGPETLYRQPHFRSRASGALPQSDGLTRYTAGMTQYGRAQETRALQRLLEEYGIVFVHGGPGMGKSLLARIACANRNLVWLTGAELARSDFDPTSVAASRDDVLVLDDVPWSLRTTLQDLLTHLPQVDTIVVSRSQLSCPGPALRLTALAHKGADSDAARYFAWAVRRYAPGVTLAHDDEMREAIASLVHLLEGHPLALALAASRLTLSSVQELVTHLPNRIELLRAPSAATSSHEHDHFGQMVMRHVATLPVKARKIILALSAFEAPARGEEIAQLMGGELSLEALHTAVSSGLIDAEHTDGEVHYRLPRSYRLALRALAKSTAIAAMYQRHADAILERARPFLRSDAMLRAGASDAMAPLIEDLRAIARRPLNHDECRAEAALLAGLWATEMEPSREGVGLLELARVESRRAGDVGVETMALVAIARHALRRLDIASAVDAFDSLQSARFTVPPERLARWCTLGTAATAMATALVRRSPSFPPRFAHSIEAATDRSALEEEDLDPAIGCFEKCLTALQHGDDLLLGGGSAEIFNEAKSSFHDAQRLADTHEFVVQQIEARAGLAFALIASGHPGEATDALDTARELVDRHQLPISDALRWASFALALVDGDHETVQAWACHRQGEPMSAVAPALRSIAASFGHLDDEEAQSTCAEPKNDRRAAALLEASRRAAQVSANLFCLSNVCLSNVGPSNVCLSNGDTAIEAEASASDCAYASFVEQLALERAGERVRAHPAIGTPAGTVWLSSDSSHIVVDDQHHLSLDTRPTLRRLVSALADHRIERPGVGVDFDTLVEATWPSEKILTRAAKARLRVAVSTLRKTGFGALIETEGPTYRLSERATVAVASMNEMARVYPGFIRG